MPITCSREGNGLLVAVATGVISLEDLITFLAAHRTGPSRRDALLFDTSAATTNTTARDIQNLVMRVRSAVVKEGPRGPVAIVAQNGLLLGMARMYQGYCEQFGIVVRVFPDRPSAEEWLTAGAYTTAYPPPPPAA